MNYSSFARILSLSAFLAVAGCSKRQNPGSEVTFSYDQTEKWSITKTAGKAPKTIGSKLNVRYTLVPREKSVQFVLRSVWTEKSEEGSQPVAYKLDGKGALLESSKGTTFQTTSQMDFSKQQQFRQFDQPSFEYTYDSSGARMVVNQLLPDDQVAFNKAFVTCIFLMHGPYRDNKPTWSCDVPAAQGGWRVDYRRDPKAPEKVLLSADSIAPAGATNEMKSHVSGSEIYDRARRQYTSAEIEINGNGITTEHGKNTGMTEVAIHASMKEDVPSTQAPGSQ